MDYLDNPFILVICHVDKWEKRSIYYKNKSELICSKLLLLKGSRLFLPIHFYRKEILNKMHDGDD